MTKCYKFCKFFSNLILYKVVVAEQGDLVDLPNPLKKQFTPKSNMCFHR